MTERAVGVERALLLVDPRTGQTRALSYLADVQRQETRRHPAGAA